MSDEREWPERAIEHVDSTDLGLIKEAAQGWLSRRQEQDQRDLAAEPLDAFIAGAAWAMQYRWDD